MARHNAVAIYGQVCKEPAIVRNQQGDISYTMCYVKTIRGVRKVENGAQYIHYDQILVLANEKESYEKMATWHVNDMVEIKGVFATKNVEKVVYCTNAECQYSSKESGGIKKPGTICFVVPIFVDKVKTFFNEEDCLKDLIEHREVSNQIYVLGELVREPKRIKVKPKEEAKPGITITQYQIALDRKYKVKVDPPEIRSDYPWVKSYGKMGKEDRLRLHTGSVVFIDGYIQRRKVNRTTVCPLCGERFCWRDDNMEIVPYDIEYMPHTFYSDAMLAEMRLIAPGDYNQRIYLDEIKEVFDEMEEGLSAN